MRKSIFPQAGASRWVAARGWDGTAQTIFTVRRLDHLPLDEQLASDGTFAKPVTFPTGDAPPWQSYRASVNFTGYDQPGSIDMAAVTFFKYHDLAYGARWIYSDKDRPVDVLIRTRAFAGMFAVSVWLNGDALYAGKLSAIARS